MSLFVAYQVKHFTIYVALQHNFEVCSYPLKGTPLYTESSPEQQGRPIHHCGLLLVLFQGHLLPAAAHCSHSFPNMRMHMVPAVQQVSLVCTFLHLSDLLGDLMMFFYWPRKCTTHWCQRAFYWTLQQCPRGRPSRHISYKWDRFLPSSDVITLFRTKFGFTWQSHCQHR